MMELAIEIGKQIVNISGLVLAGGLITSLFTELLKFDVIKVPAQKYPKTTAAVISLLLSAIAVFALNVLVFDTLASWFILAGASLLTAIKSYDWVLKDIYARFKTSS